MSASDGGPSSSSSGGPASVSVVVLSSRPLTPHLLRLRLEWEPGPALRRSGHPDEALLLHVPDADGSASSRWYTVRAVDDVGRHLTVDVVRHGGGAVSGWAERAVAGDRCAVSATATGWYEPPPEATWQLLVGDLTALPAMARIAEESAGVLPTRIVAEVVEAADEAYLSGSSAQVSYVHNRHLPAGSRLAEVVRGLGNLATGEGAPTEGAPSGGEPAPGYVYVAGETSATRAVRRQLRHGLGLPRQAYCVIGYWTVDAARWRSLWDRHGEELAAIYARVNEPGADVEAVLDRYDARVEELIEGHVRLPGDGPAAGQAPSPAPG